MHKLDTITSSWQPKVCDGQGLSCPLLNPKWHGLLYLCLAILAALSRVVCKERALGTRSLLIPALALHVQMHELCVCPMLVLNAYLHPQNPQDPVFDLMCVPSVMQRKCKASKTAGAGLLQSPLQLEDGSIDFATLNLRSQSRVVSAVSARRVTTTTSGRNAIVLQRYWV
jgi:hypothetical protein